MAENNAFFLIKFYFFNISNSYIIGRGDPKEYYKNKLLDINAPLN